MYETDALNDIICHLKYIKSQNYKKCKFISEIIIKAKQTLFITQIISVEYI